jgi:hypothetical protein
MHTCLVPTQRKTLQGARYIYYHINCKSCFVRRHSRCLSNRDLANVLQLRLQTQHMIVTTGSTVACRRHHHPRHLLSYRGSAPRNYFDSYFCTHRLTTRCRRRRRRNLAKSQKAWSTKNKRNRTDRRRRRRNLARQRKAESNGMVNQEFKKNWTDHHHRHRHHHRAHWRC